MSRPRIPEAWRDLPSFFPGDRPAGAAYYEISTLGRVRIIGGRFVLPTLVKKSSASSWGCEAWEYEIRAAFNGGKFMRSLPALVASAFADENLVEDGARTRLDPKVLWVGTDYYVGSQQIHKDAKDCVYPRCSVLDIWIASHKSLCLAAHRDPKNWPPDGATKLKDILS